MQARSIWRTVRASSTIARKSAPARSSPLAKPQHGGLKTIADQIILARALVLQILLGAAALDFIERRLRDIKMPAFDQLAHLAEKKCQQKRADMRAVDIGVGHDDDLVIAQFVGIEIVAADPGAERGDQSADFLARQHLVEARPLDIEDFSAQRKHGLIFPVAALLGGAARRIALDEKQFRLGRIALLAIGEFARQIGDIERPLAAS